MNYSHEVERMCPVTKGPNHGPAPIPEEGRWVKAYQISDISGLTHGVGWCAPQQGTCKLTLNVKNGITAEARPLFPRMDCPSVPGWKILAKACALRWERFSLLLKKAFVTWK